MNKLKYKRRAIDNVINILNKEYDGRVTVISELLKSKKLFSEDFDFIKGQLKTTNTNLSQVILNELREELDETKNYINSVYDDLIELYIDEDLTEEVLQHMYDKL